MSRRNDARDQQRPTGWERVSGERDRSRSPRDRNVDREQQRPTGPSGERDRYHLDRMENIRMAREILVELRSIRTRRARQLEQRVIQILGVLDPENNAEVGEQVAIIPRLSPEDLENFTCTRTFHVSESSAGMNPEAKRCSVCFENFKEGDKLRLLPCMHVFHAECVDRWLLDSSEVCPMCRANVPDQAWIDDADLANIPSP